jgi:hypothetical protein
MPYNCGNCNLAFFRKQELLEHEAKNHEEAEDKHTPKMECKICVALFDSHKDFYHDPDISFKNPEVSTLNLATQFVKLSHEFDTSSQNQACNFLFFIFSWWNSIDCI